MRLELLALALEERAYIALLDHAALLRERAQKRGQVVPQDVEEPRAFHSLCVRHRTVGERANAELFNRQAEVGVFWWFVRLFFFEQVRVRF